MTGGLLSLLALLASCTSEGADQSTDAGVEEQFGLEAEAERLGGTPEAQATAFEDDVVSFEEYEAAVFAYRACMEGEGATFPEFRLDTETQLYEWLVDTENDAFCYNSELGLIDRAWQSTVYAQQGDARAARRLRLVECLQDEGIAVDEDAALNELIIEGHENGFDSMSCP